MNDLRERLTALAIGARNAIVGGNLSALSLAGNPYRFVGYTTEALFLLKSYAGSHGLPQRNIADVIDVPDHLPIELQVRTPVKTKGAWFGAVPSYTVDLISLCLLCRALKPRVVFEIGTLRGYTAAHFALNSPDDAKVYTLDMPHEGPPEPALRTTVVDRRHIKKHSGAAAYCFDGLAVRHKIETLFGDSATFDYSPYAGKVDLFFIDGAHSYEYVKSDTLKALACCRPGSVIAWHDFGRAGVNGVSKWLLEFAATHEVFCVPGGSLAFMVVK
ncbi:MAG: class I SAM-dependent methyltransferase [Acidobacteriota bacterium]|nr:class I SAM-dependent methyltransferase [Acidobacteriota bacterium]